MTFNLLTEPWIPVETRTGNRVLLGVEQVLLQAHKLGAVHDASPLVTAALHRLLLAILHRALGPKSLDDWATLWRARQFDPSSLKAYCDRWRTRFDLFHRERPFLQVAELDHILERDKGKRALRTPAAQLALECSTHSNAAHLFRDADGPVTPAEAARSLLAFLGYTNGGRVTNEAESRKAGSLRAGAVVLLRGATLRETLLLNLVADPDRRPGDVPPWERGPIARTTRAPAGPIDLLIWPSRRVLLLRDGPMVSVAITAAGEDFGACFYVSGLVPTTSRKAVEDLFGDHGEVASVLLRATDVGRHAFALVTMASLRVAVPETLKRLKGATLDGCKLKIVEASQPDPLFAYAERSGEPLPQVVRIDLHRATWRDLPALVDPRTTVGDYGRPRALEQLAALLRENLVSPALAVDGELFGLSSSQAAIRDWRIDRLAIPLPLLVQERLQDVLREGLADAETIAEALRRRVLFALAAELRGPISEDVDAVRENLGTLPKYWEALGARFEAWTVALGRASDPAELRASWRRQIREVAREVMGQAVADVGLRGRAIRAAARAETVLEQVLAEHLPLADGAAEEARIVLPAHETPVWSDTTGFVPFLQGLARQKRGPALAALRRSLQEPTGIAEEARPLVGPRVPANAGKRQRELYFLVAGLFATHPEHHEGVSLADALRRAKEAKRRPMPSLDARIEALVASQPDAVGDHLRTLLPIAYETTAIDWAMLLRDLILWPRLDRLVQRDFARKYFQPSAETTDA